MVNVFANHSCILLLEEPISKSVFLTEKEQELLTSVPKGVHFETLEYIP